MDRSAIEESLDLAHDRSPRLRRLLLPVLLALVSGCEADGAAEDQVAEEAPDMWYRFRFSAEYQGKPFNFDQMVRCGIIEVPSEGPFGSTPALTTRKMHPETIGRQMDDGSHIVVRVPDLCTRNRRFEVSGPYLRRGPLSQWDSAGPFKLLPLVIWNDRRPNTTRVESYVSPLYYEQPGARITKPEGSVEFMPAEYRPTGAAAAASRANERLFDSGPRENPATGKPWRLGERPYLSAEVVVPISDMNRHVADLEALKARYPEATKNLQHPPLKVYDGQSSERFTTYQWTNHPGLVWKAEHQEYFPANFVADCIADAQAGFPISSTLPADPYDHHFYEDAESMRRDREAAAEARAKSGFHVTRAQLIEWKHERQKRCYQHLGKLRSIVVRNGRFELSEMTGVIEYRLWTSKILGTPGASDYLRGEGSFTTDGYPILWLDGAPIIYRSQANIIEDKVSKDWYLIRSIVAVAGLKFE